MKTKFKEYLNMNFKMIPWHGYIIALCAGVAASLINNSFGFSVAASLFSLNSIGLLVITGIILLFPYVDKICSGTLYQKEAYFYLSFPVSYLDIVLVKTIVTTSLLVLIPAGYFLTNMIFGKKYSLTLILLIVSIGFIISISILTGYRIGNNFRNQKKGRPNKIISYVYIAFLIVVIYFATMAALKGNSTKYILIVSMLFIFVSVIGFMVNVHSLKKYYEV